METWPNNAERGTEGEARGRGVREMNERDRRGAREGEQEGDLRSMEPAQEFMTRKGDEECRLIYGPLSSFSSALPSVMRNGCCGWRCEPV